jgi:glycopeptide antibiotics resistance protein
MNFRGIKDLVTNKRFLIAAFVCYLAVILWFTMVYSTLHLLIYRDIYIKEVDFRETFWHANNYIPFHTILHFITQANPNIAIKQIVGNVVMFVPLGFFLVQRFKVKQLITVLILGASVSVGIELIQFLLNLWLGFSYRSVDVDDVILNTIGAGLGGYFTYLIKRVLTN